MDNKVWLGWECVVSKTWLWENVWLGFVFQSNVIFTVMLDWNWLLKCLAGISICGIQDVPMEEWLTVIFVIIKWPVVIIRQGTVIFQLMRDWNWLFRCLAGMYGVIKCLAGIGFSCCCLLIDFLLPSSSEMNFLREKTIFQNHVFERKRKRQNHFGFGNDAGVIKWTNWRHP